MPVIESPTKNSEDVPLIQAEKVTNDCPFEYDAFINNKSLQNNYSGERMVGKFKKI